jgi:HPt (histidine-containing phosphotransfer) domain-containing protein
MAFLKELTDIFTADIPKVMGRIRAALDEQDAEVVERSAHRVAGSAANFFAAAAVAAARRLEQTGRNGKFNEAKPAFAELEREIDRLVAAFGQLETRMPS